MMTCGNCNKNGMTPDHALDVPSIRDCYAQRYAIEAQAASELAAEARNERWFEERNSLTAEPLDTWDDFYRRTGIDD